MNQALKKISAAVLAATMLLSFIPTAYAEKADNDQVSTFDFGASDYAFEENDGTATITIKRDGAGNAATKVAVKVADLVSEYGVDYEILDDKGKPCKRVEGTKPDPAEFVFKETGEEDEEIAEITGEASQTETTVTDNVKAAVEEQIESVDVPDSKKTVTKHDTGSNLLNAQADYLGLPGNTTTEEVESDTKQILDELYKYYNDAQGSEFLVDFGLGETEKEITIKINDNDYPNSQKIFSLCLMATDNEFTTIAPNATTYVTIQDDEETEVSDYAIVEDDIRLSPANPTATVTVKRTGGEMYFSTVELSTVTLTAPEGSYEALDNKAVAFVPGQTEATVEIKALDFTNGGTFGLRLDEDCDVDTLSDSYADVTIVKDFSPVRERTAEEMKNLESSSAQLETETLSDKGTVYGNAQTKIRLENLKSVNCGCGSAGNFGASWDNEYITLSRYWTWGTWIVYSNDAINLAGVNKISSWLSTIGGHGWNFQRIAPTYSDLIKNSWDSSAPANHVEADDVNWTDKSFSLDVSNKYDSEYLALGIESGKSPGKTGSTAGYNRDHWTLDWQKYTFDSQKSAVTFSRPIYDFINGTPSVVYTYFDGEKTKNYAPSAVKVIDSGGSQVAGFYANAGNTVYIHSANWQKESNNGLYLKGVYFVNNSKTARNMGDGTKYDPSGNYYYKAVDSASGDDPYVTIKLDQSFVKTLADKGVVSSSSSNIKIFPVYEKRDIELNFFNADAPSGSYAKYDASHRYSEISNVFEASNNKNSGLKWSKISSGKSDVYRTYIPSGSILRMGVNASNKRIPNGVAIAEKKNGYKTSHIWYKPDSTIYDEVSPNGTKITNADYTKAETVIMTPLDIWPVTDAQGISITYLANEAVPDAYKGKRVVERTDEKGKVTKTTYTDLELSVVETETMSSTNPKGVDKNGKYQNNDAYTGMEYSFTAIAPEGYVTEWKNLVGDTNGDGYIDEQELKERRRITDSPAQVYGDVYAGKIDSDRVSLVYHFVPKTALVEKRVRTGKISRSNANFLQVLNNVNWSTSSPIPSAMVNLGGDTANTDYQGNFKIDSKLPALGNANLVVTTLDGSNFYTTVDLSQHSPVVLPALEEFNALDLSATLTYKGKTNTIQMTKQEGVISVQDGSCTVNISVNSNSVILPKKAHFFITDDQGNIVVECDKDSTNYKTTNKKTGSRLDSKLTFNPKKDCYANYQLWVQFEDEGGKTYGKINTGLVFSKPLTIDEFIFPMIGSSGLEDFYRSDFVSDLIGDPLGDIGIDTLPLETDERRYSPSSLSSGAADRMNWMQYSYSYAWGKDFKIVDKKWGDKKDGKKKTSDTDTGSGDDSSDEGSDSESEDSDSDELTSTDSDGWEVVDHKNKKTSGDNNDDGKSKLDKEAEDSLGYLAKEVVENDDDSIGEVSKENEDGTKKKEAKSKFKTQGSFNFSISPSVGFRLTLSQRSDKSKYYFEDLLFYAQLKASITVTQKIVTPIGISVIIGFGFEGKITGIYYMYNNYNGDPLEGGYGETENDYLVPFTSEDFGLFKKFDEGSSVRRDFYLFIDPTLSVTLGVDIGIAAVSVTAKFAFDFDFKFTQWNNYAYGDMRIFMSYKIEVLGITVWEDYIGTKDADGKVSLKQIKIFNTDNQKGHITFDPTKPFSTPSGALSGSGDETEKFATDDIASRAYLDNRTAWNGTPDTPMNAKGSTEITLEQGAAPNARVQLQKLNDNGDMLMVWVDDDPERTDINRRAVYYSISSGDNWSEPKQIDNDGTIDDYPDICVIDENRLLVTWSSADRVLKDNEGVEDGLKALDIKAAFFDVNKKKFGKVEKLTKTTKEDYTADLNPHAAYDKETDRIILYYTKTEYKDIDEIADIGNAASVTAYLFYENGKWSNDGSFYTEDDLKNMDENYREYYKEQWYGQRFLDLRTKSESELFLAVDSTAIGYNGLGLFAWTIDWDKDLTTNDDRDVFLQIYDFEDNYFTHVIKLTNETGIYTKPQFARSNDNTYLYFGTTMIDEDDNTQGAIKYLNISDIIKNDKYTLATAGEHKYYELTYTTQDAEGKDMTVNVEPNTAMPTENIEDYDVTVTEDGRMYLFWAEKDPETGVSAQINAAYYVGESAEGTASWSNGVKLTNAGDGMYYTGIGGTVIGDTIKIGAVKSNFANDADNSLVFVNHVPYSEIMVKNLDCSTVYPMAGDVMTLTADVTNTGLKTYDDDVTVKFTIDNNEVASAAANNIPGAQSVTVTATADCPDFEQYINVMAETTVDNFNTSSSITLNKETQLDIANEEINQYSDYADDEYYAYTAYVENIGNLDAADVIFTVTDSNDNVLGTSTLAELMAKQSEEVKVRFNVDNSMFNVDKDGVGSLDVSVTASYNDLESEAFSYTIMKQFDKDAIASLNSVTDVKFENGGKFTMNTNDEMDIQPTITGAEDGTLRVVWTESSNSEVAAFDNDGSVIAYEPGTATITGYLLPCKQNIVFDSYGNSTKKSLLDDIPTDKLKKVTAEITVSGTADTELFGDLDGDGDITSNDALKALRVSVQLEESTPEIIKLGDVDGDGSITSADALELLRYSAQLSANDKIGKAIA